MRWAWLSCALALLGCDERPDSREATPRRPVVATPAPSGTGTLRGVVTFKGTAPEGEEIPASRCHASAAATKVSPVVVSGAGGLKDVMVYMKGLSPTVARTTAPAVLDQVNCQYVPHVLGVRVGQVLRVTSSDATLHNVHMLGVDNPAVNFGMTGAGQSRDLTFATPERFTVKCDVHPWMSAQVYVFDHPYFAATDGDGRYEIRGLPPGEQTVVFSHPFLGDRERRVSIGDGQAAEADVIFEKARQ
jgi:plastocyanin